METNNSPFSMRGKTILITGASSGIGQASAIAAANMGADVIICGRNKERLRSTAEKIPADRLAMSITAELTSEEDLNRIISDIPQIDGLMLCAGKGLTLPVQFCDREKFDEIFDVNFFSTVELTRMLYKKKKINKGGSIVAVASMGGTHVFSGGNSIYGSSKAAIDSFMKFAAKEFAARKIRVNTICPAMVDTPLIHRGTISDEQLAEDAKRYPLKRYGNPEDIANAATFLLSDASSWITGTSMIVDGGLSIS